MRFNWTSPALVDFVVLLFPVVLSMYNLYATQLNSF